VLRDILATPVEHPSTNNCQSGYSSLADLVLQLGAITLVQVVFCFEDTPGRAGYVQQQIHGHSMEPHDATDYFFDLSSRWTESREKQDGVTRSVIKPWQSCEWIHSLTVVTYFPDSKFEY
jgi:hypothetical protein